MRIPVFSILGIIFFILPTSENPFAAEDRYLSGLRNLTLYETAETFCNMRLERLLSQEAIRSENWTSEAVFYTTELLRTQTELAKTLTRKKRADVANSMKALVNKWGPLLDDSSQLHFQLKISLGILGDDAQSGIIVPEKGIDAFLVAIQQAALLVNDKQLSLDEYVDLLKDFVTEHPNSVHADVFALQAAQLLNRSGKHNESLTFLQFIENREENGKAAVDLAIKCHQSLLSHSSAPAAGIESLNPDLSKRYQAAILAADWLAERISEIWCEADSECVLAAAEFYLTAAETALRMQQSVRPGISERIDVNGIFQKVDSYLRSAIQQNKNPTEIWRKSVDSLFLYSLLALEKHDEANALLDKIPDSGSPLSAITLEGLTRLSKAASPISKAKLARFRLSIAEALAGSQDDKRMILCYKASALADAGRLPESIQLFNLLLKEDANNLSVLVPFGEMLSSRSEKEAVDAALRIWRSVESIAAPASDIWWDAKEAIIRLLLKKNEKEQAKQMLELLRLLRPDFGDPMRKARFTELFSRL